MVRHLIMGRGPRSTLAWLTWVITRAHRRSIHSWLIWGLCWVQGKGARRLGWRLSRRRGSKRWSKRGFCAAHQKLVVRCWRRPLRWRCSARSSSPAVEKQWPGWLRGIGLDVQPQRPCGMLRAVLIIAMLSFRPIQTHI
jgi:hypothetical protein